jgi:hypothetical protein
MTRDFLSVDDLSNDELAAMKANLATVLATSS